MTIYSYSGLDHISINLPPEEDILEIQNLLKTSGFPFSGNSGARGEDFISYNIFTGPCYLEMIKHNYPESQNPPPGRVLGITLGTRHIYEIYKILKKTGFDIDEPDRGQYEKKRSKTSLPYFTLAMPMLEGLTLKIQWIQRDPMLENLLMSSPEPNSRKTRGAWNYDTVKITGPLTSRDVSVLERVFSGFALESPLELSRGKILFVRGDEEHVLLRCSGARGEYSGREVSLFNLAIKT